MHEFSQYLDLFAGIHQEPFLFLSFFAADRLVLNHARSGVPVKSGSPTEPMKHETVRLKEAEGEREREKYL